jgi:hypothetical protein
MSNESWVALGVGMVAIIGSLLAQTLFWGTFKGTIQAQIAGINETIKLNRDNEQATRQIQLDALAKTLGTFQEEESRAKRELWEHVDDHGERIFGIEAVCKINHSFTATENRFRESHKS